MNIYIYEPKWRKHSRPNNDFVWTEMNGDWWQRIFRHHMMAMTGMKMRIMTMLAIHQLMTLAVQIPLPTLTVVMTMEIRRVNRVRAQILTHLMEMILMEAMIQGSRR